MNKDEKKKASPQIDEDLMMSLMVDGVQKDGLRAVTTKPEVPAVQQVYVTKERNKPKRTNEQEYENIFLKPVASNARNGKSVYIRPDFHERLTRIVQVIGEDKLTIYAYLDNLLSYHFQEFGDQITKSFNDKYKPIL
ncbi:conjugal transfer protein TraB [Elizabethkingia miricola]|uniref:DUF3408 domain-containing protein n=1 Tax=Elizabethkingia miricola TaxID=172045 RepID=UPI0009998B77|nr:DUF3408 domain-containing protein [Elizabethkingia miricola]OPB86638.1 conjugal transfer protein TraB [Elizabethkingia miricola]